MGALAQVVAKVRVPVLLAVDSDQRSASDPPLPGEVSVIAKSPGRWLQSGESLAGGSLAVAGYIFTDYGRYDGDSAVLLPVTLATHADSRHVWDAVNNKVRRYRKLAMEHSVPFVVVLSAEPRSGLDYDLVASALGGRNSLTPFRGTHRPVRPSSDDRGHCRRAGSEAPVGTSWNRGSAPSSSSSPVRLLWRRAGNGRRLALGQRGQAEGRIRTFALRWWASRT